MGLPWVELVGGLTKLELSVRDGTLGCGLTVSVILRRFSYRHDSMIASKAERRPRKSPGLG